MRRRPRRRAGDRRGRTALHDRRHGRARGRAQIGRRTRCLAGHHARRACRGDAPHPVPHELQAHPHNARRGRTPRTGVDQRTRRQTTALRSGPAPLRQTPQARRIEIPPQRERRSPHHPPGQAAGLDSKLAPAGHPRQEAETRAAGITPPSGFQGSFNTRHAADPDRLGEWFSRHWGEGGDMSVHPACRWSRIDGVVNDVSLQDRGHPGWRRHEPCVVRSQM